MKDKHVTIRVPANAVKLRYFWDGDDGYEHSSEVTMGMFIRIEDAPDQPEEREADE